MRAAGAGRRVDQGSAALTQIARQQGIGVEPLNGAIDAIWWLGSVVRIVDYKGTQAELTPKQAKLIAQGCPIRFVSSPEQAMALVAEMKREAWR